MENRVYITNYNMEKFSSLISKNVDVDLNQELFKIDKRWFNNLELESMITAKMLFESPEELLNKVEKIKIEKNSREIFVSHGAAYHLDCDCQKLNSDYKNYNIPNGINENDEEFMKFFKILHDSNLPDAIKIKQFQNKYPGIDYPEYITRENSGVTEVENFSIQSLEGSIDRDI
ncbi:MAG: hypothetical protein ACRC0G_10275, partial [Fusobacteriaceae bacterium]